jgi:predicted nucleic acid-binding protein
VTDLLIDSNVLLDVFTEDPRWFGRSAGALARLATDHDFVVNPIVYAEVSVGFTRIEELDAALPAAMFRREALPWEAAFLAGKCFLRYRRAGGARRAPLLDFYIGAHAPVRGIPLLTRDAVRYRPYFPRLELLVP